MQPGFDAHRSGHNFVERSISPATAGSLAEEWSTDLAGEIQTPIVQSRSGLLHAIARHWDDPSSGRLYGLEAATGEVVWTVELDLGPHFNVVPTLIAGADHDVFVGRFGLDAAPYGRLDRFDARTGAALGSTEIAGPDPAWGADWLQALAVRHGEWIVTWAQFSVANPYRAGTLFTVTNLADPSRTWSYEFNPGEELLTTNPIIVGNRVYLAVGLYTEAGVEYRLQGWDLAAACEDPSCPPSASIMLPPGGSIYETYPVGLSASQDGQQVAVLAMGRLDVVNLASGAIWSDDTLEPYYIAPFTLPVPTWSPEALLVPAWSGPQKTPVVRAYAPAGCGAPTCDPLWVSEPVSGQVLHQPASNAGGVVVTLTDRTMAVYPTACTDPCAALVTHTTSSSLRSVVAPTIAAGRILFAEYTSVVAWRPPPA